MNTDKQTALRIIRDSPGIYGVPLRKSLQEAAGRPISYGYLYALMSDLEAEGWVTAQAEAGNETRGGYTMWCWHLRRAID